MTAMLMRKYFGGSRVLVAEDETALGVHLAATAFRARATILGPGITLSETRAMISREKPTVAVLGPFARELNLRLFMIELFERHLPALFYVQVSTPLPLLTLKNNSVFLERAHEDELLSAIAALRASVGQRGPLTR